MPISPRISTLYHQKEEGKVKKGLNNHRPNGEELMTKLMIPKKSWNLRFKETGQTRRSPFLNKVFIPSSSILYSLHSGVNTYGWGNWVKISTLLPNRDRKAIQRFSITSRGQEFQPKGLFTSQTHAQTMLNLSKACNNLAEKVWDVK